MNFSGIIPSIRRLVSENSTTILTSIGVTGTVTTAYLTGKASFKAAEIIRLEQLRLKHENDNSRVELSLRDKAGLVWKDYIPAVGTGVTTVTCIIMANRMSSREAAALAAAYGLSERALSEYKTKFVEKFGENKARALQDDIAQDRVNKNPITKEVIITGSGEVLCYDMLTDRYFMSSVETIRKAQNDVNEEIIQGMYASLGSFYDKVGLRPAGLSEEMGWNSDNLCEVVFSTVLSQDQRPCVAISFAHNPIAEYQRIY